MRFDFSPFTRAWLDRMSLLVVLEGQTERGAEMLSIRLDQSWKKRGWPVVRFAAAGYGSERRTLMTALSMPCLIESHSPTPWQDRRFRDIHHDLGQLPVVLASSDLALLLRSAREAPADIPLTVPVVDFSDPISLPILDRIRGLALIVPCDFYGTECCP